jgi:hypothetical protein
MTDELKPVDGNAWTAYTAAGRDHFAGVGRSWTVFHRNAVDLLGLIDAVETDPIASLKFMNATAGNVDSDHEDEQLRRAFWEAIDQRLHNLLASAVSLVDHTRRLVAFYDPYPDFQQEFQSRNDAIAAEPRTAFLRKLRNYLLHFGVAPTAVQVDLGPAVENHFGVRVSLSGPALLEWSKWNAPERRFIEGFEPGPPLRPISAAYAQQMSELYQWLFSQRDELHPPGAVPSHLAEGRRADVYFGEAADD